MRWLSVVMVILILANIATAKIEEGKQTRDATSSISDFGAKDHHLSDGSVTSVDLRSPVSGVGVYESSGSDGGSLGRQPQTVVTTSSTKDPVTISKKVTPKNKNGYYPPGYLAEVIVEVYSNKDIELDIMEFIDNDLMAFYPTVHGYCLTDPLSIILYKRDILNYLESTRTDSTQAGNRRKFNYSNIIINISDNCMKDVNEYYPSSYMHFLLNQTPLFEWDKVQNGSLTNYIGLKNFIENKLNELSIENSMINKTENGSMIIISKENRSIISIYKSSDVHIGYVYLYYDNIIINLRIENGTVFDSNNVLAFKSIRLKPGDLFVFWYYVKVMKPGYFDLETIATINEPKQTISSITTAISDNRPDFRVNRAFTQYQNFINDNLDIIFNVEYLGGGTEPDIKNVSIYFDRSEEYEYVDVDGNCSKEIKIDPKITKSFSIGESKFIKVKIKLNSTGVISPPGIGINGKKWSFNETVTVDKPIWRYFGVISLFFTGVFALFLFLVTELYFNVGTYRVDLSTRIFSLKGKIRTVIRANILYIIGVIFITIILLIIGLIVIDFLIRRFIDYPF